jgi:hypothetical protein
MQKTFESSSRWHAAKGGIIAGLIGGAVLSVFMLIMNLATAQDIWVGMKIAGEPFLGERAMQPGFDLGPVLVGVLSHFAVSLGWGLLFGVLFYGASRGATVALGAVWGVVVWLGMFYAVLPLVGLAELARAAPVGMAVFEHVLFGLAVGLGFLPFQRRRPRSLREAPPVIRHDPVIP